MIHPPVAMWQRADVLLAPTGVTAVRNGVAIDVNWSHAGGGGATGFRIYRRSRSPLGSFGAYTLLTTVSPASTLTHKDTTASGELEYQYRVHTWTGSVESAGVETGIVDVVAPIQWEVGYPADYAPDDTSIAWGFQEAVDQSGVQVYRRIGSSMGGNPIANGTLISDGILTFGTTNLGGIGVTGYIVARARYGSPGSYLYGPWSEERSQVSLPRVPGAPTGVSVSATGSAELTLVWSAGTPANQTTFEIEYRTRPDSGSPWSGWAATTPPTDPASPFVDSVIEGYEHQYRVRAVNAGGESAWVESNVACASAPAALPTITSVTTVGVADPESQLRINYSAAVGVLIEVRYRSVSGGGTWLTDQGPDGNGTPFDLTGLADGQTYDVQIRATNYCGASSAWTATTQGTTATAVPEAPVITSVLTQGDDRLRVFWDAAAEADDYDLQMAPDSGGSPGSWSTIASGISESSDHLVTGLSPNTRYHFRVRGNNEGGAGPYSDPEDGATLLDRPASFIATHHDASCPSIRVDLSWSNSNIDADLRSETMTLQRSSNGGASWTTVSSTITAGETSYTDLGATEAINRYRIRYNSESVWSEDPISIICPL
ncbi:fibronectin type III domain-containing protein [Gaopeijia maritima]|uniref:fibronectin type III domain-containing protein n=1 Tax=Gaopeijia maritima TaxID=3119007 RepID=UPI003294F12E